MEKEDSKEVVLQVKNLKIAFAGPPSFLAVDDLSFTMEKGKSLVLVGPSGSGKSLISLSIMGLLPTKATVTGSLILEDGRDLLKIDSNQLTKIRGKEVGMVFQEPMNALNPVKTCGYQLVEAILAHQTISRKEAKKNGLSWMERVKLPEPEKLFKRYPHQLSGGQKQRVMIAIAMCNHPKILIADEPTTALDVTVQFEIVKLMRELQHVYRIALLFITHDLNLAKMIADDFLVIENGKIIHDQPAFFVPQTKPELIEDKRINPLLRVENVSVSYELKGKMFQKEKTFFKAVDDVNFYIKEGETLGLVGESGCGKSTLTKAILGLQSLSKGKLYFEGEDITDYKAKAWDKLRKKIQIVFQDPLASLNPRMKVGDAIKEPMFVHHIVAKSDLEKETIHLLELVQLPPSAKDKYPHEFSGGQRQRICIARALALKPKLVICDESVSALDVKIQAQILELLRDLQLERKLTYLFITHDLNVVKAISNRVLIMEKGKIVEQGLTEEIMTHPQKYYTKCLLAAIPNPNKKIL